MVIDTFMFFNELDILDIRLRELQGIVDVFILLECEETLAGIKKPLIFEENQERFKQFLPSIRHVKLRGLPPLLEDTEKNRFWLEAYQRNSIMLGLAGYNIQPDDLVLVSDVDEIPKQNAIKEILNNIADGEVWIVKQKVYHRYFDRPRVRPTDFPWLGTVGVRYNAFSKILPQDLRRRWAKAGEYWTPAHEADPSRRFVETGGWHLHSFGSKSAYEYKTANFAHGARGGIAGTYGDPRQVRPAAIAREEESSVKPLEASVQIYLSERISDQLSDDIPDAVQRDLATFYHLFESSKYRR